MRTVKGRWLHGNVKTEANLRRVCREVDNTTLSQPRTIRHVRKISQALSNSTHTFPPPKTLFQQHRNPESGIVNPRPRPSREAMASQHVQYTLMRQFALPSLSGRGDTPRRVYTAQRGTCLFRSRVDRATMAT